MAEIVSRDDKYPGRGHYYLAGNGITNDYTYTHSQHVDGETKYGKAAGFPRRCCVGAAWETWNEGYYGSRSFISTWIPAYSGPEFSLKYNIRAEIVGEGHGLGYYLGYNTAVHPEYIHHTKVDGDNTYGKVQGFPRKGHVGGTFLLHLIQKIHLITGADVLVLVITQFIQDLNFLI